MSKITDAFTIQNAHSFIFSSIQYLRMDQVFNDPGSLNYVADFVNCYSNIGTKLYRVGIIYRDPKLNTGHGQDIVLFEKYAYPLQRVVTHLIPMGVGIFLEKDAITIDKNSECLGDLYPTVNFAVSGMSKVKAYRIPRNIFGASGIPYEEADTMTKDLFNRAYDTARGMMIGIKVHDKPVE